jgi:hypothetical protein
MKADYLKKLRKQCLLVNIKGGGANERPCLREKNVLAHENENRVCKEENRDGEENDGHGYCLAVVGPCHESGEGHLSEGEGNEEVQVIRRAEDDRHGHSQEVFSVIDDYYMEDIVHKNEEGGGSGRSRLDAVEFENCTDNEEGIEHAVEEFCAPHEECGQGEGNMQKERPKREKNWNWNEEEAPRTGPKIKERANAFLIHCEIMKDTNIQSEVPPVDIKRISEVSKKIIVKHAMGCDNLVEVMKSICAFAKQLPGYRKYDFAMKNFKERRTLELDFVTKWTLEERVVLRDVNLFKDTGMVNVHSAMMLDK